MKTLFIEYPKCTTCKRAKKFLKDNNVKFEERNIVEENPTREELLKWIDISGIEVKKFFNTSGVLYREMGLKDKVKNFTIDEAVDVLSSNGMLVKRPILIHDGKVVIGFKEDVYKSIF